MKRANSDIWHCVDAVVTGLSYDFVGVCYGQEWNSTILRVFIDSACGIDVDDCAVVSHQLSVELDIENLLNDAYVLEVSSPGLDRPLFREEDFIRFSGALVKLKLSSPRDGRRRFKGRLISCRDGEIEVDIDDQCYRILLSSIDQAHLVPSADEYRVDMRRL